MYAHILSRFNHPKLKQLLAISCTTFALVSNTPNALAYDVPVPDLEHSPSIGPMWNAPSSDLASEGIVEQEYFFSGTTQEGEYKSRMIVRLPEDPKRFNGTVIVEWMNASSGIDIDVDFPTILPLMKEKGFGYVAVTAQQITVNWLTQFNPARYDSLFMSEAAGNEQPAAFEVFSQAGKALLNNGDGVIDPLNGLVAERLIAIGQSQSSSRLTTFVSTIHGQVLEPVYDAVLPHAGGGVPTSFPVPVLKLNSENEAPGYYGSRNVSDSNYRYWEVPGTSHSPLEGNQYSFDLLAQRPSGPLPECPFPHEGLGGPTPIDPVLRAAISHLDAWVRTGVAPPEAPLIEMVPSDSNPNLGVIVRDNYGNGLGGIRMPQQEVPTGRNGPSFGCKVFHPVVGEIVLGTFPQWDAFDGGNDPVVDDTDMWNGSEPASAKAVYRNHGRYVSQFIKATKDIEKKGHILKFDAQKLRRDAAASGIAQ